MRPMEFPEVNVMFAKDQPQYMTLPACRINGGEGRVITCWGLSWGERLRVLFTGKLWLSLLTFGSSIQPVRLEVGRPEVLEFMKGGTQ